MSHGALFKWYETCSVAVKMGEDSFTAEYTNLYFYYSTFCL